MQFQSDLLDSEIVRPCISETTAFGAALISGLSSGFFKDMNELKEISKTSKTYVPNMDSTTREKLYSGWKKAINAARYFK